MPIFICQLRVSSLRITNRCKVDPRHVVGVETAKGLRERLTHAAGHRYGNEVGRLHAHTLELPHAVVATPAIPQWPGSASRQAPGRYSQSDRGLGCVQYPGDNGEANVEKHADGC
jgi:hypothetical protein